jgi:hypothetical protein
MDEVKKVHTELKEVEMLIARKQEFMKGAGKRATEKITPARIQGPN